MEEELEKPKVLEDPKVKNIKRIKRFLIVSLAILIISVVAVSLYYVLNQKNAIPSVSQTPKTTQIPGSIAKVGDEYIYQTDFDYYISLYYPESVNDKNKYQENSVKALEKAIDDSMILQDSFKSSFISLNNAVFNSPDKNIASRSALIEKATNEIRQKNIKTISGEIVSIWFNNANAYPPPSIGIENAKQQVKQKIDTIYQDIKSGKITMMQAGQRIRSDSSQRSIDPSYLGNAYTKFTNLNRNQKLFADEKINESIWSMGKNELSSVILANDVDKQNQPFEAFYTIIQVIDTTSGNFLSLEDYINNLRDQYEIIRY